MLDAIYVCEEDMEREEGTSLVLVQPSATLQFLLALVSFSLCFYHCCKHHISASSEHLLKVAASGTIY